VRRLVVLVGVAVALAVVVWLVQLVGGNGRGTTAGAPPAAQPSPSTVAAVSTTPPPTANVPQACAAAGLGLTLTADAGSYPRGGVPTFTVTIVNRGPTACLVDAGDAQREIVVTSGADRVWSSRDCAAPDAQSRRLLLAPSVPDATQVRWPRTRSAAGCPAGQPAALKGTYSATLTLAGASSPPVPFVLG
jgi:hypothetical protein